MACSGLLFPDTCCPESDVGNMYLFNVCDIFSEFTHLPRLCLSTNSYQKTIWTSYHELSFVSILLGVPVIATDCLCSVWDHGWTNCLMYDGSILVFYVHK